MPFPVMAAIMAAQMAKANQDKQNAAIAAGGQKKFDLSDDKMDIASTTPQVDSKGGWMNLATQLGSQAITGQQDPKKIGQLYGKVEKL